MIPQPVGMNARKLATMSRNLKFVLIHNTMTSAVIRAIASAWMERHPPQALEVQLAIPIGPQAADLM